MARLRGKQAALKRISAIYPEVVAVAERKLREEAGKLADIMRQRVPVDTGNLRASIRVVPVANKIGSVRILAGGVAATRKKVRKGVKDADFAKAQQTGGNKGEFDYARAVEFGHIAKNGKQVPAEPFFFATYRAEKRKIGRRISTAARKKAREAFNK